MSGGGRAIGKANSISTVSPRRACAGRAISRSANATGVTAKIAGS